MFKAEERLKKRNGTKMRKGKKKMSGGKGKRIGRLEEDIN